MAKERMVTIMQCGRVCDKVKKIVHKMMVCHEGQMMAVKEEKGEIILELPDDGIPFPDEPPTDFDDETKRLLSWFIQDREEIAETLGYESLYVTDEGLKGEKRNPTREKLNALMSAFGSTYGQFLK